VDRCRDDPGAQDGQEREKPLLVRAAQTHGNASPGTSDNFPKLPYPLGTCLLKGEVRMVFPAPGDILSLPPKTPRGGQRNRGKRRCPMELVLTNLEIRALKETLETEISHLRREITADEDRRAGEGLVTRKELLVATLD